MSTPEPPVYQPHRRRRSASEEPIEVRRYLDAIRRSRVLILAIVLVLTSTVFVVSLGLPERYEATASIVKRAATNPFETVSVDSLTRELSTIDRLLETSDLLEAAGKEVGLSRKEMEDVVDSSVDPDANLIFVTATRGEANEAARTANAVAETFVAKQTRITRSQYEQARALLQQELDRVSREPDAATQEQALRERLSEIGVAAASAGTDLSIAQSAEPPEEPSSPRPFRNAILAMVLGLFLGVVVALGRDQLVPRVTNGRELGRLLDLPVLASVPYVGRRFRRRAMQLSGIEYDTYQALASSLRFVLPPDERSHMVLISSALHAEGKSTVSARLGRALAQAGHDTLLISADLRWPTLHTLVNVPAAPGLTDLLAEYEEDPEGYLRVDERLNEYIVPAGDVRRGTLDVLPSGTKAIDPAHLLTGSALDAIVDAIGQLPYAYVLVDSAPLLGIADTQAVARRVRNLLYVARLDRLTVDNVLDARDVIDRFDLQGVGLVVVGARSEASPYYFTPRAPVAEET